MIDNLLQSHGHRYELKKKTTIRKFFDGKVEGKVEGKDVDNNLIDVRVASTFQIEE